MRPVASTARAAPDFASSKTADRRNRVTSEWLVRSSPEDALRRDRHPNRPHLGRVRAFVHVSHFLVEGRSARSSADEPAM